MRPRSPRQRRYIAFIPKTDKFKGTQLIHDFIMITSRSKVIKLSEASRLLNKLQISIIQDIDRHIDRIKNKDMSKRNRRQHNIELINVNDSNMTGCELQSEHATEEEAVQSATKLQSELALQQEPKDRCFIGLKDQAFLVLLRS